MEKREEIKDGVKQRLIEFMAEQITKEDSFADLKSELIEEFLVDKKIKNVVVEKTIDSLSDMNIGSKTLADNKFSDYSTNTLFDKMAKSKEAADKFINDKVDKQGELIRKIFDIKTGKDPVNLKKFMDTALEKDSDSYKEIIDLIEGNKLKDSYNPESFTDYSLRYNYRSMSEEQKKHMRDTNIYLLKKSLENKIDNEFYIFNVKTFNQGENLRREYLVENKINKFKFECSYVFNNETKETYIDRLYIDAGGLLIQNEDLGVPFAIEALEIMDSVHQIKEEADKETENKLSKLFNQDETESLLEN